MDYLLFVHTGPVLGKGWTFYRRQHFVVFASDSGLVLGGTVTWPDDGLLIH